MNVPEQPRPAEGWRQGTLEDWQLFDDRGEMIGSVVWQKLDGERVWYSVSERLRHGPIVGKLTECKRRLEKLWRERLEG